MMFHPRLQVAPVALPAEDVFGGKAGKVVHPLLISDVSNLYKAHKSSSANRPVITFH